VGLSVAISFIDYRLNVRLSDAWEKVAGTLLCVNVLGENVNIVSMTGGIN
jgi:hypothetical protein